MEEKNEEWKLLLALNEIIYILFKKDISFETHICIFKISNWKSQKIIFKSFWKWFKAKISLSSYYPNILKNIGPLSQTNSMRFESKHQSTKKTAHNSNNRINVLKFLHMY